MASGDSVVQIVAVIPPGTLYATEDVIVGASTPAESFPVWDFDDTTAEYMDFLCKLEGYAGGGLTFTVWSAAAVAGGTDGYVWRIAIRALPNDAEDIDTTAHTYDFNSSLEVTPPSAIGEIVSITIAFTNGADMDSWAEGELAIVRVGRAVADAADTMTGDAMLAGIFGLET